MTSDGIAAARAEWRQDRSQIRTEVERSSVGSRAILGAFTFLVLAMIFLQKLGLTLGDASIGLDWFFVWTVIGGLLLLGIARLAVVRLLLFLVLLTATLATQALLGTLQRPTAMALLLLAYAPFVVELRVDPALFSKCLQVFRDAMVAIACIVLLQQLTQYTIGHKYWPNLENIVPPALLYPGYAYLRPYQWNSPYLTPNGVFFLEPSALSYYLALATALELLVFRSVRRLTLYAIALLACLAATGPLALALASPLWFPRLDAKIRRKILWIGVPLLVVAMSAGLLNTLLSRAGELGVDNSSAYTRIVVPLTSIIDQITKDPNFLLGHGAGSSPRETLNSVQWPLSKLLHEYGLLVAILFHLFLLFCLFGEKRLRTVMVIALIPYLFFGGGFVSQASVLPLLLLGSLLKVEEEGRISPETLR